MSIRSQIESAKNYFSKPARAARAEQKRQFREAVVLMLPVTKEQMESMGILGRRYAQDPNFVKRAAKAVLNAGIEALEEVGLSHEVATAKAIQAVIQDKGCDPVRSIGNAYYLKLQPSTNTPK